MKIVESFDWNVGNHVIRALIRDDDTILWESLEQGTTRTVAEKVQDLHTLRDKGAPHWVPDAARTRVLSFFDKEADHTPNRSG